ncbi:MAG TPA: PP2C family protein-serine/threonine phosphatase [Acidimicrobiales bacterium]|nr:PP2C family protein-serine/threonine phosphatase [Acidimicrobiales bacterium]
MGCSGELEGSDDQGGVVLSELLDNPSQSVPGPRPSWLSGAVLLAGLVLTGSLAWVSETIHDHDETRLLNLELHQAASVVAVAIPSIQLPLSSASSLAAATDGDPQQFRNYMGSFVGGKGPFVSASLWRVENATTTMVALVGSPPELATTPAQLTAALSQARRTPTLEVLNLLNRPSASIGYASASLLPPGPWVVYAERDLPKNRKLNVTTNSAFSQLNYALYLGRSTTPPDLLGASPGFLSTGGTKAKQTVAFGSSVITLVATPNTELGSSLLARLPWIVAVAGGVLSIVAALVTDYLVRRRRQAEWLAAENRRMYSEQRSIAEILQHALLPQTLPEIAGVETAIRYVAGGDGADVGGDWYDVIPLDHDHFIFVLGDVSGRGVEAATIMARLHFAIRAYAAQGDGPAAIMGKLGKLLSIDSDRSFATILCAVVDVAGHSITLVNAGHPPLLMLNGSSGAFIRSTIFPPVGIQESTDYRAEHFDVPAGATVVAFTDGLIERRDETIDTGLERLRALTLEHPLALDDLLTKILTESRRAGYHDDTAILAVRWKR